MEILSFLTSVYKILLEKKKKKMAFHMVESFINKGYKTKTHNVVSQKVFFRL